MATAFETGLEAASTAVTGYISTYIPIAAGVMVAFLGVKYLKRFIKGF
jgi:hypothetical protein